MTIILATLFRLYLLMQAQISHQYFMFKPAIAECKLFFTKSSTKSDNGTIWGPKFCDKDQGNMEIRFG